MKEYNKLIKQFEGILNRELTDDEIESMLFIDGPDSFMKELTMCKYGLQDWNDCQDILRSFLTTSADVEEIADKISKQRNYSRILKAFEAIYNLLLKRATPVSFLDKLKTDGELELSVEGIKDVIKELNDRQLSYSLVIVNDKAKISLI